MSKRNTIEQTQEPIIGTYELSSGAIVSIPAGSAYDHASIRACQLSSLLHVIHGGGAESFHCYSEKVKDEVIWLASGLADELQHMLKLVRDDAIRYEKSKGGGS